jgi:hypothetical protein
MYIIDKKNMMKIIIVQKKIILIIIIKIIEKEEKTVQKINPMEVIIKYHQEKITKIQIITDKMNINIMNLK